MSIFSKHKLTNAPTIMITGASRGIGLATAKQLAQKGCRLALFDIDIEELRRSVADKMFNKLSKNGGLVFGQMDVAKSDDWDNAIEQTTTAFGSINTLINNAGILVSGDLPKTVLEQQLAMIDINCKGMLIGCHKVAKRMIADNASSHKRGNKIINLSSASAIYGQPEIAAYSASKFFVRGLTEALNIEYEKYDIKVVDVMPLWVQSDMTKNLSVTSLERLGLNLKTSDVANVLVKLASKPNKKLCKTHYPVGIPAKLIGSISQITPNKVVHFINKKVAS